MNEEPLTETQLKAARKIALVGFLANEYDPPLPLPNRRRIIECFMEYWDGELDVITLRNHLWHRAGYRKTLDWNALYMFLDKKEFN